MNAIQIYRLLLKIYPRHYREAFEVDMVQTFADYHADVMAQGGHTGMSFWTLLIADDVRNAGRQHLASLAEGDRTVPLPLGRLALATLFLIPLFVLLSATSIALALAVPHPPINGIIVPIALISVGIVIPGILGIAVSWGLAGLVQRLWAKRTMVRLRA
jgi:hypothetical protein